MLKFITNLTSDLSPARTMKHEIFSEIVGYTILHYTHETLN